MYNPDIGEFFESEGEDSLSIKLNGKGYATINAAMAAATADDVIVVGPGTYSEDVTWSDASGVILAALIPGTVTIEAVTAFAISIDPAAASGTWTATIRGIKLSHGDGLVGLQVDNSAVGKRINLIMVDVDIESETPTDHAIDVNRSGAATDAIRIYATGRGNTIEGLVHYITECTDDRVRFWGYRLVGGFECVGAVVNELTFVCCGILTDGLTVNTSNVYNTIACYNETDANPNVHGAVADAVEQ
jgi:hypothetical protein